MKKMWRKGNPNEKMWRKGNPNEKMWRTTEIPPLARKIYIPNPPTRAASPEMWRN